MVFLGLPQILLRHHFATADLARSCKGVVVRQSVEVVLMTSLKASLTNDGFAMRSVHV